MALINKDTKDGGIRVVLTDYGRGKYYSYVRDNKRYQIIELNFEMLRFDKELFFWVLSHEIEHLLHYADMANEGRPHKQADLRQAFPSLKNIRMVAKLSQFERKFSDEVNYKEFAVHAKPEILENANIVHFYRAFYDSDDYFDLTEEEEKEIWSAFDMNL